MIEDRIGNIGRTQGVSDSRTPAAKNAPMTNHSRPDASTSSSGDPTDDLAGCVCASSADLTVDTSAAVAATAFAMPKPLSASGAAPIFTAPSPPKPFKPKVN